MAYSCVKEMHGLVALRLCEPSKEGAHMRRKMLAGVLAAAALALTATPAFAGSFGPGNSDKGPKDPGAKCHPPGQTVNEPGCK
jgi:hypothetical protein